VVKGLRAITTADVGSEMKDWTTRSVLESVTVTLYARMGPFRNCSRGGLQLTSMLEEVSAVVVMLSGGPDGAVCGQEHNTYAEQ
jgi:hypothetical protein